MTDLLLKIFVTVVELFDAAIGYIVVNGNVTDPKGNQIIDAVVLMTENLAEFLAEFTNVLVNGIPI